MITCESLQELLKKYPQDEYDLIFDESGYFIGASRKPT